MSAKKHTLLTLTAATAALLVIPCIALVMNWHWTPAAATPFYTYLLYLVTESGTLPYALFTAAFLAFIPVLYLRLPLRQGLLLIIILAAAIGSGQLIKSTLKTIYQEPRPYIVWLEKTGYITETNFYQLNRNKRYHFIASQNFSNHAIPAWMQNHWSKETGYSFPSGHTIFVAQWLMMFLLLLKKQKAYTTLTLVALWALTIEASRLLLGMHWPVDLIVSCLLAFPITCLACLSWKRWVFPANNANAHPYTANETTAKQTP